MLCTGVILVSASLCCVSYIFSKDKLVFLVETYFTHKFFNIWNISFSRYLSRLQFSISQQEQVMCINFVSRSKQNQKGQAKPLLTMDLNWWCNLIHSTKKSFLKIIFHGLDWQQLLLSGLHKSKMLCLPHRFICELKEPDHGKHLQYC